MSATGVEVGVSRVRASPWVCRWSAHLPEGASVLDFAGGGGRNLPPLLARRARVLLADRAPQAPAGVEVLAVDLERGRWPFEGRRFDAVICCNYLFRPRLALLLGLVAPGGMLIYETFAQGNSRYGKPERPDFLLRPGELPDACAAAGLSVRAYEHGYVSQPRPAIVQRVCAVRAPFADERVSLVG